MGDFAFVIDHGRNACVAGLDKRALKLKGSHSADVQVLVHGQRIAKPSQVAEIDPNGGCWMCAVKSLGQFFSK